LYFIAYKHIGFHVHMALMFIYCERKEVENGKNISKLYSQGN